MHVVIAGIETVDYLLGGAALSASGRALGPATVFPVDQAGHGPVMSLGSMLPGDRGPLVVGTGRSWWSAVAVVDARPGSLRDLLGLLRIFFFGGGCGLAADEAPRTGPSDGLNLRVGRPWSFAGQKASGVRAGAASPGGMYGTIQHSCP
jgi:hypothetical protein